MACRICSSTRLKLVLDLGNQPWCNHFLKAEEVGTEPFYPLRLMFCTDCNTAQLDYTVKKEVMFGNHTYLSGVTKSLSNSFKQIAHEVHQRFKPFNIQPAILDIGSNDGTQLKHYQELGWEVLGVESSLKTSQIANDNGVPTLHAFFNFETMQKIGRKYNIINASGVFFHLEELHSVTKGIKYGLDKQGVFVVQFLYMKSIMENDAFDQIYHEHLLYYTLETIQFLLHKYDLEIFDAYLSPMHGGQMVAFVGHNGEFEKSNRLKHLIKEEKTSGCNNIDTYIDFSKRIEKLRDTNLKYLINSRNNGKKIFGMGAPVKGNTLLNYFKIGPETIECLLEKNHLRKNLFSPGMHIPIKIEEETFDIPDIYYVLAWNFKKEILKNNQHLIEKGVEFYFPINPKISL